MTLCNPRRPYAVIFADDDADMLHLFQVLGKTRGWEVDTANTAETLLEKVEVRCHSPLARCYDIVVTDVSFFNSEVPGISGIAAARQLERKFPNLPILFLTGYNGLLTRENVRSIPNADVLEKPIEANALANRVEYLIKFTKSGYDGPERRRTSINRSEFCRRATDSPLGVPKVLKIVLGAQV